MKEAEKGFIIVSSRTIREGIIVRRLNGLVLFRFVEGGGIQIPEARVFTTKEEAQRQVNDYLTIHPPKKPSQRVGRFVGNAWCPL